MTEWGPEELEATVAAHPYYRAMREVYLQDWLKRELRPGAVVLNIGSGTGAQSRTLQQAGLATTNIDLQQQMLKFARGRLTGEQHFLRANAENLPLREACADACVLCGLLHHAPRPEVIVRQAARALRPGGRMFIWDPRHCGLRFLFDGLQKLFPIYRERGRHIALLHDRELAEWLAAAGCRGRVSVSSFLPPHLYQLLPPVLAAALLRVSDALGRKLPLAGAAGGVLVCEAWRTG